MRVQTKSFGIVTLLCTMDEVPLLNLLKSRCPNFHVEGILNASESVMIPLHDFSFDHRHLVELNQVIDMCNEVIEVVERMTA